MVPLHEEEHGTRLADEGRCRLVRLASHLVLADHFVGALRTVETRADLARLMASAAEAMGFRHYALIHHDDLRKSRPDRVDLRDDPASVTEKLGRVDKRDSSGLGL